MNDRCWILASQPRQIHLPVFKFRNQLTTGRCRLVKAKRGRTFSNVHFACQNRCRFQRNTCPMVSRAHKTFMNDTRPWYFQDNPQNCLTAVTEHALSWDLDIIISEWSEPEKFWNTHTKIPLGNPEISWNVVLWDVFWKFRGRGVQNPPPNPLSRSAPA